MMCTHIKKDVSGSQPFRQPGSHMELPLKERLCRDAEPGSWMDPDRASVQVLRERWKLVEEGERSLFGKIV